MPAATTFAAEPGVVVMMVDVDHEGALEHPLSVSRVSCAQSTATRTRSPWSSGTRTEKPAHRQARNEYSPAAAATDERHGAVLARADEREVHGEQRAERIAVGVLVEVTIKRSCVRSASATAAMSLDVVDPRSPLRGLGRARRSTSSSGRRPRPTDRTGTGDEECGAERRS